MIPKERKTAPGLGTRDAGGGQWRGKEVLGDPRPGLQALPVLVSWKKARSWHRREEKSSSRTRRLILDMMKVKVLPRQPADSELRGRRAAEDEEERCREGRREREKQRRKHAKKRNTKLGAVYHESRRETNKREGDTRGRNQQTKRKEDTVSQLWEPHHNTDRFTNITSSFCSRQEGTVQ